VIFDASTIRSFDLNDTEDEEIKILGVIVHTDLSKNPQLTKNDASGKDKTPWNLKKETTQEKINKNRSPNKISLIQNRDACMNNGWLVSQKMLKDKAAVKNVGKDHAGVNKHSENRSTTEDSWVNDNKSSQKPSIMDTYLKRTNLRSRPQWSRADKRALSSMPLATSSICGVIANT